MNKVKAMLADADGTLITRGRLDHFLPELKKKIAEVRRSSVLFNLASGRPYFEQQSLFQNLVGTPVTREAILYEASSLRFLGQEESYNLGGLTKGQIHKIERFIFTHQIFEEGMVPQANSTLYEASMGYVTHKFFTEGVTDKELLERNFQYAKLRLERNFSFIDVVMSADAVDIFAKGITKAKPTLKYSEVSGIPLSEIAAIGDSGNDMPMLEVVGKAGGLVIYVGEKPAQEEVVRGYAHNFIPNRRGPLGTVEGLEYILKINGGK